MSYIVEGTIDAGYHSLAMEWLSGEDLGSVLRRGPLSLPAGLIRLERVAAALAVTHEKGIVHRGTLRGVFRREIARRDVQ